MQKLYLAISILILFSFPIISQQVDVLNEEEDHSLEISVCGNHFCAWWVSPAQFPNPAERHLRNKDFKIESATFHAEQAGDVFWIKSDSILNAIKKISDSSIPLLTISGYGNPRLKMHRWEHRIEITISKDKIIFKASDLYLLRSLRLDERSSFFEDAVIASKYNGEELTPILFDGKVYFDSINLEKDCFVEIFIKSKDGYPYPTTCLQKIEIDAAKSRITCYSKFVFPEI